MTKIGVIGLGRMGSAMAQRFAAQGVQVVGWTRSGSTVDGVPSAPTISDLVAASDVIVTSLYDDAAVAEVLDTLLTYDLNGKLIVETSTVTPTPLTDRIDQVTAKGAAAVDAPISGGPEMVLAGTCGIFIGGDAAASDRAAKALSSLTGRVLPVGPLGTGLVMKTINNALLQVYVTGLRQLLPVAREAGLPLETVLTILNGGPAGLPFLKDRTPKILGEDTETGFTVAAVIKDNLVFQGVIKAYGLDAPVLGMAQDALQSGVERGLGDEDPALFIADSYAHRTDET